MLYLVLKIFYEGWEGDWGIVAICDSLERAEELAQQERAKFDERCVIWIEVQAVNELSPDYPSVVRTYKKEDN